MVCARNSFLPFDSGPEMLDLTALILPTELRISHRFDWSLVSKERHETRNLENADMKPPRGFGASRELHVSIVPSAK